MKYMDLPVLINEVFKGVKWLIGYSMLLMRMCGKSKTEYGDQKFYSRYHLD